MRHDPGLAASPLRGINWRWRGAVNALSHFPLQSTAPSGRSVREKELARDPPVALAADDHPDRLGRLVAVRAQAVWRRGVERDRVARAELVLVEADAHAEPAADDVAVLLAAVPHQRVLGA